jgi:hypothetical protein
MARCLIKEQRNDAVEDILAGLARVSINAESSQRAIARLREIRCASADRRVALEAIGLLEALMADSAARCQALQAGVIGATGYPYGREPETEAAR